MGKSHEIVHEIWDDKHGDRHEVGHDRDGLDMVEIRYIERGGVSERMSMDRTAAFLVANAILKHLEDVGFEL